MNQSSYSSSLSHRLCRLQLQTDGQYHQLEVSGQGCLSFMLPRLPRALFDWCEGLCAATWVRHQRCMAIMLLLDMQQREWDGQVPHQQSMPDGVCWQAGQRDWADLPSHYLLAGSMQVCTCERIDQVKAIVPACDGVHFVQQLVHDQRRVFGFVRTEGRLGCVHPSLLLMPVEADEPH